MLKNVETFNKKVQEGYVYDSLTPILDIVLSKEKNLVLDGHSVQCRLASRLLESYSASDVYKFEESLRKKDNGASLEIKEGSELYVYTHFRNYQLLNILSDFVKASRIKIPSVVEPFENLFSVDRSVYSRLGIKKVDLNRFLFLYVATKDLLLLEDIAEAEDTLDCLKYQDFCSVNDAFVKLNDGYELNLGYYLKNKKQYLQVILRILSVCGLYNKPKEYSKVDKSKENNSKNLINKKLDEEIKSELVKMLFASSDYVLSTEHPNVDLEEFKSKFLNCLLSKYELDVLFALEYTLKQIKSSEEDVDLSQVKVVFGGNETTLEEYIAEKDKSYNKLLSEFIKVRSVSDSKKSDDLESIVKSAIELSKEEVNDYLVKDLVQTAKLEDNYLIDLMQDESELKELAKEFMPKSLPSGIAISCHISFDSDIKSGDCIRLKLRDDSKLTGITFGNEGNLLVVKNTGLNLEAVGINECGKVENYVLSIHDIIGGDLEIIKLN